MRSRSRIDRRVGSEMAPKLVPERISARLLSVTIWLQKARETSLCPRQTKGRPIEGAQGGIRQRGGLAPVVSAAAATAAIVPAGIGAAEVGAAHVAVVVRMRLRGFGGGHETAALVPITIEEVMRQLLAGHHACADRETGRQPTDDP